MANVSTSLPTFPQTTAAVSQDLQVRFKGETDHLLLLLPPESEGANTPTPGTTWAELWQQLQLQIASGERFWLPNTPVNLLARNRLLDGRQLQAIADVLAQAQLSLSRVHTSRRQTAVAAVTAGYSVEQQGAIAHLSHQSGQATTPVLADTLYVQTTLRSGSEIRHGGSVVLVGDANPGSAIIADGDILVWGRLRGMARAGANGNHQCRIMALHLQPTQLRIGTYIARAPEPLPARHDPEVAYVSADAIHITQASEFSRIPLTLS